MKCPKHDTCNVEQPLIKYHFLCLNEPTECFWYDTPPTPNYKIPRQWHRDIVMERIPA